MTVADSLSTQKPDREKLGLEHTREFVDRVFGSELHPLRMSRSWPTGGSATSNSTRSWKGWLLVAMAHTLLTLLGAASEASGLDRYLKVNTAKKRTHSLYRQRLYWYHCIPTMREEWLRRLMDAFDRIVREHAFFSHFFNVK